MNIWMMLGLKPEGFRAGLKTARDDTKQFEKDWKGLAKIFAAGGLTSAVTSFFTTMIEHARNAKNGLDQNVAAVRRFGGALDDTENIVKDLGVSFLGFLSRAGEAWGGVINIIKRGVAATDISDAAAKGAEDAERSLAKAKEHESEFKSISEGIKTARKGIKEAQLSELTLQEQLNARENDYYAAVVKRINYQGPALGQRQAELKVTQALLEVEQAEAALSKSKFAEDLAWYKQRSSLQEKLKADKMETLTADQQVLVLQKDIVGFKKEQGRYEKGSNEYLAQQVKINQANRDIEEARLKMAKQITAEIQKQLDAMNNPSAGGILNAQGDSNYLLDGKWYGGKSIDPNAINGASSEALAELIRRRRGEISGIQANRSTGAGASTDVATGGLLRGIVEGLLQTDINRAQRELDQRNAVNRDNANGGVALARRNFAGDPLAFDRFYDEFVKNNTEQEKTNQLLGDLVNKLGSSNSQYGTTTNPTLADALNKGFGAISEQLKANGQINRTQTRAP